MTFFPFSLVFLIYDITVNRDNLPHFKPPLSNTKFVDNESCVSSATASICAFPAPAQINCTKFPQNHIIEPMKAKKNLIIVGDRVLLDPDERMDRTTSGLYLPPTVKEKEKVLGGYVIKTGPGYAIHDPVSEESWTTGKQELKYIPLQASEGDYAIFLRESAIEIEFEGKKYLIVPHSAILALVRTEITGIEES
jgi:chaperonin GroES